MAPGLEVLPDEQLRTGHEGDMWHLQVDVYCVEDDGCVLDACCLAAVRCVRVGVVVVGVLVWLMFSLARALQDTRLPELRWDEAAGRLVVPPPPCASQALSLRSPPYALSFALLDRWVVADPCHEEEDLAGSVVHVVWDSAGQLRAVDKPGGVAMTPEQVALCVEAARSRVQQIQG